MARAGDTIYASRATGLGMAQLQRTTVQSVPHNTQTAISFNAANLDRQGGWNSGVNPTRYTPTVAGWYLVSGLVGFAANATGQRQASIRRNGTTVPGSLIQITATSSGSWRSGVPAKLVLMNGTTDYLELYGFQSSGGALDTTTGDGEPNMTIVWAGAA